MEAILFTAGYLNNYFCAMVWDVSLLAKPAQAMRGFPVIFSACFINPGGAGPD
jgi:hypothetical protein